MLGHLSSFKESSFMNKLFVAKLRDKRPTKGGPAKKPQGCADQGYRED